MPRLPLDDADLYYEETGTGQPLVFLHGGWSNTDAWGRQVSHFADDYRVVTVDTRGHGRTGPTDRRRYTLDLYVDDLEELLSTLDVERPVICGISQGGMVTQAYLDRHPDRAAAAVIAGPARSMPPVELPGVTKSLFTPVPALAAVLATTGTRATYQSLLGSIRSATGARWLCLDEETRKAAVDAVAEIDVREFLKVFDALYSFDPPDLSGVETPTLVVYGEHESPLVKRQGRQIAGMVADGTVREIADAAHLVNQDRPDAFNEAVGTFLAEHGIE